VYCPTDCGLPASTLTRIVLCKGTVNGEVVVIARSYCTAPKPPTTVTCPPTPKCVIYKWKLGDESCPEECGLETSVVTRSVVCVKKTAGNTMGTPVADSYCDPKTKPDANLYCAATAPCEPVCAATDEPCTYPSDCCSGVCVYPKDTKHTKGTKGTKHTKGTKKTNQAPAKKQVPTHKQGKGQKRSEDARDTKGTKHTKGTKDARATCGCYNVAASCTKNVECCSGKCKGSKCVPMIVRGAGEKRKRQDGMALGLGIGGGVGAAAFAIGLVVRRRRAAPKAANEPEVAREPLSPHGGVLVIA